MKIPLSWLKEYITLPSSLEEIDKTLTLAGIEVDAVETLAPSFEGVVVAEVIEAERHPNADRLTVAKVFDGTETLQIVCGAPNCRPGIKVALAKIGASLQDEEGPWKIKKGKLRDVESFGMLCSADELKIGEKTEGILELPSDIPLGTDIASLYNDTILHLSLTPNLGHCMSVYGIARELSAFFDTPLKSLSTQAQEGVLSSSAFKVKVEDKDLCPHYSCSLVKSVQVGPSPDWLKRRLELCGIRSINNVVDISNYVMLAIGQPLHFFDFDKMDGRQIQVTPCKTNTTLTTLDGIERTLPEKAIVIQDKQKILTIAGVMGAQNCQICDTTQNVFIEAAVFHATSIRKTSRILGLKTDASSRFERGVDPNAIAIAIQMANDLLTSLACGKVEVPLCIAAKEPLKEKKISCRVKKVQTILGISLSPGEISKLLSKLQIWTTQETDEAIEVIVPSFRNDLTQEIDIIEEIARLYGFNNLPKSNALHISSPLADTPFFALENLARQFLLEEGLQEFLTCDLISPDIARSTQEKSDRHTELLSVLQSKSSDYSVLRPSLLPGLLQVAKYNLDHQNQNIFGFEVGRVHFKREDACLEQPSIGIILSGNNAPHSHQKKSEEVTFFDLKGIIENLLHAFGIEDLSFEVSHLHNFQPGRQARIKSKDTFLGVLGEIHPFTREELGISQRVYFAELDLQVVNSLQRKKISVTPLPLFPTSERDWTVSLRKDVPIGEVLNCIENLASPLLEKVFLLDLFESEKIGIDRKNATWRFIYRDTKKTIESETVETIHTDLLQKVAQKLGNCIL